MLRDEHSEPIRNRFTAYLVVAVTNRRIRYMSKQKKIYAKEIYIPELLEIEEQDVETQYFNFLSNQGTHLMEDWERFEDWFRYIDSERLLAALEKLKERDKTLLFARVFGKLSFAEIGEILEMKPKQAEMAFYYVIRKLKKELEVKKADDV